MTTKELSFEHIVIGDGVDHINNLNFTHAKASIGQSAAVRYYSVCVCVCVCVRACVRACVRECI